MKLQPIKIFGRGYYNTPPYAQSLYCRNYVGKKQEIPIYLKNLFIKLQNKKSNLIGASFKFGSERVSFGEVKQDWDEWGLIDKKK